jgi:hypothetical protein
MSRPTADEILKYYKNLRCNVGAIDATIVTANWAIDKVTEERYIGIKRIGRSKPKYQPKVGDKVFWGDTKTIYTIEKIDIYYVMLLTHGPVDIRDIKPATLELMGKPWDEVPNC